MRVLMPSLEQLTARDRRVLGPAMRGAARIAGDEGRRGLEALFASLAEALAATDPGAQLYLDALADLDDLEVERLVEGTVRNRAHEAEAGHPSGAAFFEDLGAALRAERRRRQDTLAAIGRSMAWAE